MIDKILCWMILKIGFKEEQYMGPAQGGHLFGESKRLLGFPEFTGNLYIYDRVVTHGIHTFGLGNKRLVDRDKL